MSELKHLAQAAIGMHPAYDMSAPPYSDSVLKQLGE